MKIQHAEQDIDAFSLQEGLLAPQYSKQSVLVAHTEAEISTTKYASHSSRFPSQIIADWLYLGSASEAADIGTLNALGITHILNVTKEVDNFFLHDPRFKYAQISMSDWASNELYDYFEATKAFIDECNPLCNAYDTASNCNKILVHCAVGMSRSASVVIAYLISASVELYGTDRQRLIWLQHRLDGLKHAVNQEMQRFMEKSPLFAHEEMEQELGESQRQKLTKYRMSYHKQAPHAMALNEAYYYVKSCRHIVCPNIGFMSQLQRYEKLYHNGQSTLRDTEKFTLILENDIHSIWTTAAQKYPNDTPISNTRCVDSKCACVLL